MHRFGTIELALLFLTTVSNVVPIPLVIFKITGAYFTHLTIGHNSRTACTKMLKFSILDPPNISNLWCNF